MSLSSVGLGLAVLRMREAMRRTVRGGLCASECVPHVDECHVSAFDRRKLEGTRKRLEDNDGWGGVGSTAYARRTP